MHTQRHDNTIAVYLAVSGLVRKYALLSFVVRAPPKGTLLVLLYRFWLGLGRLPRSAGLDVTWLSGRAPIDEESGESYLRQ